MQCQKFITTNENGEKVTFRGCQLDGEKTDMCYLVTRKAEGKKGVLVTECETCNTDNCNGSEQHLISASEQHVLSASEQHVCTPSKIGENIGRWLKEIIKVEYFGTVSTHAPMLCQKFIATNENGEKVTFRGCQLDGEKIDMCSLITSNAKRRQGVKVTECETCNTDNCNGSEQHLLSASDTQQNVSGLNSESY
ncbi:unnamed protein product [Diamesa hyperborea]